MLYDANRKEGRRFRIQSVQFSSVMMITITKGLTQVQALSEVKPNHVQSIKSLRHCFEISPIYYQSLCTESSADTESVNAMHWQISPELSHVGDFDLDFQMSKLRRNCNPIVAE